MTQGESRKDWEEKHVIMACGVCNFWKRKCSEGCVFAPYFFFANMDVTKFCVIHKIFGRSNFSRMLKEVPVYRWCDVVDTIYYEVECQINNPIQGCLTNVFSLRKEVYQLPFSIFTFIFCCYMRLIHGSQYHIYIVLSHLLKSLLHSRSQNCRRK